LSLSNNKLNNYFNKTLQILLDHRLLD